ncbi:MAG: hypothetical protein HQK81_14245 [Desulfovibrionaceae bacterium]|nr:hypothetical protein [Desulfovibrionaceae bacterium]MBF0515204.1 hypothetical protein [Desulfovibrionaceae bacterium]
MDERKDTVPSGSQSGKTLLQTSRNGVTPARRAAPKGTPLTGPEGDSLTIRLMASDKSKILENAALAGLTPSEYARRVLLGKKVEAKQPIIEAQAIAKLESIRGLIKQLWKSERFDTTAVFNHVNQTLAWIRRGGK